MDEGWYPGKFLEELITDAGAQAADTPIKMAFTLPITAAESIYKGLIDLLEGY
jgi:hypothetical protein